MYIIFFLKDQPINIPNLNYHQTITNKNTRTINQSQVNLALNKHCFVVQSYIYKSNYKRIYINWLSETCDLL